MKVTIRNPRRKELEVNGGRQVGQLLQELHLNPESHIVVLGDELLTADQWLQDEDCPEIISAVSGG